MTSSHRSLLLQNSHAIPWSAPSTKPATVNSANPVRKARGLPEIGNGLAGASAASSPKGGNRTSKMAHKIYATPRVVASENACTFQESAFGSAVAGVEDFASGAAFGAAATAAGATGAAFGAAATGVEGFASGAAWSWWPPTAGEGQPVRPWRRGQLSGPQVPALKAARSVPFCPVVRLLRGPVRARRRPRPASFPAASGL